MTSFQNKSFHYKNTKYCCMLRFICDVHVRNNECLPGMRKNFKIQEGETFDFSYDVSSIMHYGR